jgi:hypothetical protein
MEDLSVGISLLSVAVSLLVGGGVRGATAWGGVAASTTGVGLVGWYVLTGRYLPLEEQSSNDE